MMKKMFKALLATGLAVSLLGACGNAKKQEGQKESKQVETSADAEKKTDGEKTELLLWMPPFGTEDTLDKEMWKKVLAPFEKENNCNVTVEVIPWSNYEEKYLTAISSGAGPDLGYMYMEMMNDYIDMGALEPFDSYLTDKEKDNFYYLDKGVIDGKQYALPIVVGNARILCYNKKLLEQAGVEKAPETWDEFLAACKKLKDAGITPIQQQWGDASKGSLNSIFFPYLWQAGGEYTRFLHVFLPELKRFLKEEGILEDTFFHISDEPKEEDMDSFHAAVESVKELLQDCKVMDALSSFAIYRRGDVKKPVVSVNHIEPFVEAKVQNLWAYYCTGQAVEVPNRFIAMPSSRNRILGVLCYIYRLEGFLHWGFNFYNSEKSREHIDPFKVTDAGEAFPSGDPFLVYPGKEGIPYESLRLVVLQEAMADLRVLNKAEQKFGRDKVMEGIERLAGGKISFKDYPRNKQFFYQLRAFLQEILAG